MTNTAHPSEPPKPQQPSNQLTVEEAKKRAREFLEKDPLFKPLSITLKDPIKARVYRFWSISPEAIHLHCDNQSCNHLEATTWQRGQYVDEDFISYECANCKDASAQYWTRLRNVKTQKAGPEMAPGAEVLASFEVIKLGQWPLWAPKLPNRLLKNLGSSAPLFRRGLACLQEGLGIGASAYFRRVIEEEVKTLLDLVERAATLDGDEAALENLRKARASQVASERLGIAVQKVPPTLRPGNANPLAVLYGALSGAVHQEPEDVALATATRLLKTFTFLFEELKERMEAAEAYAAELQQLRDDSAAAKGRS